ncbi:hypothetical protein HRED_06223 [Candidatus Haloredivivus sp. G17]|nr:hypothetical protein HRED_06223 [Candidatus Haloredivivus sp. G17]
MEFSISKMKEVMKARTGKRVSREAAEELSADLESKGQEITASAIEIAERQQRIHSIIV